MKRVLAVFLLLILLASAQSASQASAQSTDETKRQATAAVVYSQNAEANELFLKARDYYNKSNPRTGGTLANAREAIKLYEAAVKRDPKFALAYVGLSRAWMRLGYSVPGGMTNKELLPHAKSAALKALELDKNLLDAHLVLAGIYFNIEFDWEKAEREYKLAVSSLRTTPLSTAATPLTSPRWGVLMKPLSKLRRLGTYPKPQRPTSHSPGFTIECGVMTKRWNTTAGL
jgi:tetratricopeptide (TPR) repeat protein